MFLDFFMELVSIGAGALVASVALWVTHFQLDLHGWKEGIAAFTLFYITSGLITSVLGLTSNFYNVGVVFCLAPAIYEIAVFFSVADQMSL